MPLYVPTCYYGFVCIVGRVAGCDSHGFSWVGEGSLWAHGQRTSSVGSLSGKHGGESSGVSWSGCSGFRTGDVIGVTLDMAKRTLAFAKNGQALGIGVNIFLAKHN